MQVHVVARSSITWGPKANMESLVEMVTFGVHMIPCLLWKGYQDGNIWMNYFIASIIFHVKNILYKKVLENSSMVANYIIFWDDIYMHQVMLNV